MLQCTPYRWISVDHHGSPSAKIYLWKEMVIRQHQAKNVKSSGLQSKSISAMH